MPYKQLLNLMQYAALTTKTVLLYRLHYQIIIIL